MVEKIFLEKIFTGYDTSDRFRPDTIITDIDLVKRDLLNHFLTRRGERVMRPRYGSIIWDMLFEQFTEITRDAIVSDVERIVSSDSRVVLQEIDVVEFEHGLRINVALLFRPFDVIDTFNVDFDRRNRINDATDFL